MTGAKHAMRKKRRIHSPAVFEDDINATAGFEGVCKTFSSLLSMGIMIIADRKSKGIDAQYPPNPVHNVF